MKDYIKKINLKKFFLNIILPTVLTIGLFIVLIFSFIVPYFEHNMLNSKKEMINELVNSTIGIAAKYEKESAAGLISVEEAGIKAKTVIEHLRYGTDSKDYFWITDMHPTMIMHPYRTDLNGNDLSDFKDPNGKKLFVEMVNEVKKNSEGYVDYMWQWMDDSTTIVPKISYVKEFKPWGWIIGTGIYIEDVRKEISAIEQKLILVSLGISGIMALLLTFIVRQNLKVEIKRGQAENDLKISREKYKALVEASTEGTGMFLEGKCIYSNKKLLDILEVSELSFISIDLHEIISPDRFLDLEKIINFDKSAENYLQFETQILNKKGSRLNVLLSVSKITLSERKGFIIVIKDLSGNETNTENNEYNQQLSSLSKAFNIGIFKAAPGNKIKFIDVNEEAVSILDFSSKEELLKTNISDIIEDAEERKRFFREVNKQTYIKDFPLNVRKKNGLYSVLSISAVVERDVSGNINCITGMMTDITMEKTIESLKNDFYNDLQASLQIMNQPVKNICRNVTSCEMNLPLNKAAKLMTSYRTDALLICSASGEFIGIITDHDIRECIAATGNLYNHPVYEFMNAPLTCICDNSTISDAVLLMQKKELFHLIVTDSCNNICGIIDRDTLLKAHYNTADFLTAGIQKSTYINEIENIYKRLPLYVGAQIENGARTYSINNAVTGVSDAITRKLAGLIIDELGIPPVPFAFIALGSEGREEQTLLTDQDNAIIYADVDENKKEQVHQYFLRFGKKMCGMLDKIGYNFCPGNIMAKNPRWCQPVSSWKKYFSEWIINPEPQNLVDIGVFFDFRCIYGDTDFTVGLKNHINAVLKNNSAFFGQMARVCANYKIPLSLFGKIQTESAELHADSLNIKNPSRVIVNLVRLFSMQFYLNETNTLKRLKQLYGKNVISSSLYQDLIYAFDFMMVIQFRTQAIAYQQNKKIDNYISLSDLSTIELNTLKYIFSQITTFQAKIKYDFGIAE